ncbi:hypothetical protein BHYA_0058g00240 [Botrytis hyacinthi]|uniref:Uncharacterized protein n=1 Tax=Botrytis hyacinthi TaxID=278943 RepID=A0A4Z1H190_9HELO|nr:hypothetical protein BHYA_0058g00240 [Botrytis hyacinthi]
MDEDWRGRVEDSWIQSRSTSRSPQLTAHLVTSQRVEIQSDLSDIARLGATKDFQCVLGDG